MMGWYQDGMSGSSWIFMVLVMVVFWALVLFAVVAIFRGGRHDQVGTAAPHPDALEILEERFARGEIDVEEYHARKTVLREAVR